MMVSPEFYIEQLKEAEYQDLIRERDDLIQAIKQFEKLEMAGDRSGPGWEIKPSPEVQYQMHLEYLGALCVLMHEKYNEEYVWGERSLQEDAAGCNWKE